MRAVCPVETGPGNAGDNEVVDPALRTALCDQQLYYRRRAVEYDATSYGVTTGERDDVAAVVDELAPTGDVLELACGTGVWTEQLARRTATLTAVDGAPEMLAVARARLGDHDVAFVEADIFSWRPPRRYDVVFFAFWLSHVPPDLFDEFWGLVAAALRPGGRALFVDEPAEREALEGNLATTSVGPLATRTLRDGTQHRVVKVFWDAAALERRLGDLGWHATVRRSRNDWYAGEARPDSGRPAKSSP
jgi:SAM-dependent methyltransferase